MSEKKDIFGHFSGVALLVFSEFHIYMSMLFPQSMVTAIRMKIEPQKPQNLNFLFKKVQQIKGFLLAENFKVSPTKGVFSMSSLLLLFHIQLWKRATAHEVLSL